MASSFNILQYHVESMQSFSMSRLGRLNWGIVESMHSFVPIKPKV